MEIIFGSSGSGKTFAINRRILDSAQKNPDIAHIVMVPEQFTLHTQKKLICQLPSHGIMNIDVLSFERLAYRVFAGLGGQPVGIMDSMAKNMLLRKAAGEVGGSLKSLSGAISKPGFVSRVRDTITELMSYGQDVGGIMEAAGRICQNPALCAKLSDIAQIFCAFRNKMDNATITEEELLPLLVKRLPESDFLDGAIVAMDGFTDFSAVQYKIIGHMIQRCKSVTIALTLPYGEELFPVREHELFALSKEVAGKLFKFCGENGISFTYTFMRGDGTHPRYAGAPSLSHLESEIFRGRKTAINTIPKKSDDKKDSLAQSLKEAIPAGGMIPAKLPEITVFESRDPLSETVIAAECICNMTRNESFRYRDIAIVCADTEGYGEYIRETFSKYGIPHYLDMRAPVTDTPLIEFLRGALAAVASDFSRNDMFRYLRSGLAGLSREEVDILDTYVNATGQRGYSRWNREWDRPYKGCASPDFQTINALRKRAIEPFAKLKSALKGNVACAVDGVKYFLEYSKALERMLEWSRQFEQKGDFERSGIYSRIYDETVRLLDSAQRLMGDENLSIREFAQVIDAGISDMTLGVLPSYMDCVQVGDIKRSRLEDIRALVFLGFNDDVIPASYAAKGIFTDEERAELENAGLGTAPVEKRAIFAEKFHMYRLLTRPSEKLVISYSRFTADSAPRRPSPYIKHITRLFNGLSPIVLDDGFFAAGCRQAAMAALASTWNATNPERILELINTGGTKEPSSVEESWLGLYIALSGNGEGEGLPALLSGCFPLAPEEVISKNAAQLLYGGSLKGSVSRFEKFAACPCAHFLRYGLRLYPRAEYKLDNMDRGTLIHRALQEFFNGMAKLKSAPRDMDDATISALVDTSLEIAAGQSESAALGDSAKSRYYIKRQRRLIARTVRAILRELDSSGYRIMGVEKTFDGSAIPGLSWDIGGGSITLSGVIDRIDVRDFGNARYVRIIDYKTGEKKVSLADICHGQSLQLPVYLEAAIGLESQRDLEGRVCPGGIYYYNVKLPIIDGGEAKSPEDAAARAAGLMVPVGITNSDLVGIDAKKDARSAKREMDTKLFSGMRHHVLSAIGTMGQKIINGDVAAHPVLNDRATACAYCDFASVCGFDQGMPGCSYNRIPAIEPDDIREIWRKEGGGNGTGMD